MNSFTNAVGGPGRKVGGKLGPDMLHIERLHALLGFNEEFKAELTILMPHLRKITASWQDAIPRAILSDPSHQDTITIRDLNAITAFVGEYLEALYSGRFYETFEAPLDGIALILRKHGVNPGWATVAFSNAFENAQQRLFFETRKINSRIFPAALRCMLKIIVLTIHLLNRRDHELNEVTPQVGVSQKHA